MVITLQVANNGTKACRRNIIQLFTVNANRMRFLHTSLFQHLIQNNRGAGIQVTG
jgi:hypothetical protein